MTIRIKPLNGAPIFRSTVIIVKVHSTIFTLIAPEVQLQEISHCKLILYTFCPIPAILFTIWICAALTNLMVCVVSCFDRVLYCFLGFSAVLQVPTEGFSSIEASFPSSFARSPRRLARVRWFLSISSSITPTHPSHSFRFAPLLRDTRTSMSARRRLNRFVSSLVRRILSFRSRTLSASSRLHKFSYFHFGRRLSSVSCLAIVLYSQRVEFRAYSKPIEVSDAGHLLTNRPNLARQTGHPMGILINRKMQDRSLR